MIVKLSKASSKSRQRKHPHMRKPYLKSISFKHLIHKSKFVSARINDLQRKGNLKITGRLGGTD